MEATRIFLKHDNSIKNQIFKCPSCAWAFTDGRIRFYSECNAPYHLNDAWTLAIALRHIKIQLGCLAFSGCSPSTILDGNGNGDWCSSVSKGPSFHLSSFPLSNILKGMEHPESSR
mmetsp:Transcript_11440/g.70270  ORF Transcript_11440/g.70270 Transcript_11440/m.70270 type:complete len:116 (-) Transcript_11440:461-808(-)